MTTIFPARPAQNEDPWFGSREVYDKSLEKAINDRLPISKGVIDAPLDLDTLVSFEDCGTYNVRYSNLINGPELSVTADPVLTLVVRGASNNGFSQTIYGRQMLDQIATRSMVNTSTYGDWALSVSRAEFELLTPVVSADRYVQVSEGQTLYLIDPESYSYNFSKWPNDMERLPEGAGSVWVYNSDSNLLGGRGVVNAGSSEASVVRLGKTEGFTDGDILTRMSRRVVGSFASSLAARVSLDGSVVSAYLVSLVLNAGQTRIGLGVRVGNATTTLAAQDTNIRAGDDFWVRFNLSGSTLKVKAWLSETIEPEDWLIAYQDELLTSGFVGFQSSATSTAWDVLSVNTSGGVAP